MRFSLGAILVLAASSLAAQTNIPDDFPRFQVPGHDREMAALRSLFWLHYPGAGPKATLWDEWLSSAALWPATRERNLSSEMRRHWSAALSQRILDDEGYVATHQHASIAHQLGWPFPFWNQGRRGGGWHFSFKNTVDANWRPHNLARPDGWTLAGAAAEGITDDGWALRLTQALATATAPAKTMHTFEAPFLQLRWLATNLGNAQPWIEWTAPGQPAFSPQRRMYFAPPEPGKMEYAMVPMYRHPAWTGEVSQLRIGFGNAGPARVTIQAFFTQYDTRHNINAQNFIRGCATYFAWTRDLNFLRQNINRMRTALRYLMTEHQTLERKVVFTDWVGHDGRSGLRRLPDGKKEIITGRGIGNNYWDLLPFGHLDCYATAHYYDALGFMIRLEREILEHPEWRVPRGVLALEPAMLERHRADVRAEGNRLFWNPATRRFGACVDADGQLHDYGLTFLNLEAVSYGFATPEHARDILSWINGDRLVPGDTAQGPDIYHWRFGPRATTRRNIEWYFWAWNAPEGIPFGGQVQDGGAVLGFAYHDLMARLQILGPDNAWQRLRETIRWFEEVQAAGGYRKYYDGKTRDGSLQGGGTPGGLGLDHEFFESVLVPQVMLYGFLGFQPAGDGFALNPRLPADWPELAVDRVRFHDQVLRLRATQTAIEITPERPGTEQLRLTLPPGSWKAVALETGGGVAPLPATARPDAPGVVVTVPRLDRPLRLVRE